jgi:exosome complex component RRP41
MPSTDKITLLQLDGVLTPEEFKKCVETGIKGCKIVYELQKKALTEKYFANGDNK